MVAVRCLERRVGSFHPKTNDPRFAIAAVSAELGWMGVGESGTVVGGGAAAVGVGPRSFGAPAISVVKCNGLILFSQSPLHQSGQKTT